MGLATCWGHREAQRRAAGRPVSGARSAGREGGAHPWGAGADRLGRWREWSRREAVAAAAAALAGSCPLRVRLSVCPPALRLSRGSGKGRLRNACVSPAGAATGPSGQRGPPPPGERSRGICCPGCGGGACRGEDGGTRGRRERPLAGSPGHPAGRPLVVAQESGPAEPGSVSLPKPCAFGHSPWDRQATASQPQPIHSTLYTYANTYK